MTMGTAHPHESECTREQKQQCNKQGPNCAKHKQVKFGSETVLKHLLKMGMSGTYLRNSIFVQRVQYCNYCVSMRSEKDNFTV